VTRFLFFLVFLSLAASGLLGAAQPWSQVERDGIYVQYHPPNRLAARELLDEAVAARKAVVDFFLYKAPVNFRVLLTGDRAEFRRILGNKVPDWGGGIALPGRGAIILFMPNMASWEKPLPAILRHEITHLVLYQAMKGRHIPLWLNEGLAMYLSREWRPGEGFIVAKNLLFNSLIPLDELNYRFPDQRDRASLAYQLSYSAVSYMVEKYGEDGLKSLLFSLMAGKGFPAALREELGVDFAAFQSAWMAWLRHRYRWVTILAHPGFYLGLLTLLFLLSFIAVKFRNRRKVARWEREEKLRPRG